MFVAAFVVAPTDITIIVVMVFWGIGLGGVIVLWVKILMEVSGAEIYPKALSGSGLLISLGYLCIGPFLGKKWHQIFRFPSFILNTLFELFYLSILRVVHFYCSILGCEVIEIVFEKKII